MTTKTTIYQVAARPPRGRTCAVCRAPITGAHIRGTTSTGAVVHICPACASEAYTRARTERERQRGAQ